MISDERRHTFPIEYINPFLLMLLPPAGTPNILKGDEGASVALHGRTGQGSLSAELFLCKISTKARREEDGTRRCHTARLRREVRMGGERRSVNFVSQEGDFGFRSTRLVIAIRRRFRGL